MSASTIATLAVPRPGRFRKFARVFVVLTALFAILAWVAPHIVVRTELRNRILRDIFADLKGTPSAGGGRLSWFSTIELTDVVIADPDGRVVLTSPRVTSSKTLIALLRDRADLGTFTIEQPRLDVIVEQGTTNIEQAIANYLVDSGRPAKPERLGLAIEANGGQIRLTDAAKQETKTLDDFRLTLRVPRPRTEPVALNISAASSVPDSGTFTADCLFHSISRLKLTSAQFDIGSLGPLVRRFAPDTIAEAKLGSDLTLTWGTDAETHKTLTLDGTATARQVRLEGPSWLGPDKLRLDHLTLGKTAPVKLSLQDDTLNIDHADMACDIGTANAKGTFNTHVSLEKLLAQTGVAIGAEIDVARLGTLMPHLLHIREGTRLTGGKITIGLENQADANGPFLRGSITTTALTAVHDKKPPYIWKEPLKLNFQGRLLDGKNPRFDTLTLVSDFVAVNAAGDTSNFAAAADVRLGDLFKHVGNFVDLSGFQCQGKVLLEVVGQPMLDRPQGNRQPPTRVSVSATFTDVLVKDHDAVLLQESKLTLNARADLEVAANGKVRIDRCTADARAVNDSLTLQLLEPIADLAGAHTGRANIRLVGDFEQWKRRASFLGAFPPGWTLRGQGDASAEIAMSADAFTGKNFELNSKQFRFIGGGINANEPELFARGTIRYDRRTKVMSVSSAKVVCPTAEVVTDRIELNPTPSGSYGLTTTAKVSANLTRLQRTFNMQSDPAGADAVSGAARGTVRLDAGTVGLFRFATDDLRIENVIIGPEKAPGWREPWITLAADGSFDTNTESVKFLSFRVAREGIAVDGKGDINRLQTDLGVTLDGNVDYDLAKLEPTLKSYLGKSATAVGKDRKPYLIRGNLRDGGKNLAVAVGGNTGGGWFKTLGGHATVAWQSLKAYGFDVGSSEVRGTVDHGLVSFTPVQATFGGGKVRVVPSLMLNPGAYDLTLAKGKVIDRAKLTPAALSDALGFALPAIANSAQADGVISFDLDEAKVPLANPNAAHLRGTLTVHESSVSAGPVMGELIGLLGVKSTSARLVDNAAVPIELINGRVHHRNFALTIDTVTVRTSGSVGLDGSLEMTVDVPLNEKIIGGLNILKDRPRVMEAIARQTITIRVGGTVAKPRLDPGAFRAAINKVVDGAVRDATKSVVNDAIKGGLDKLPFPFLPKKN